MSEVHTFRADTMLEAIDLVRQELGSDAVILNTRHFEQKRMFPWQKQKAEVEITAGLDVNIRGSQAASSPARTKKRRTMSNRSVQPSMGKVLAAAEPAQVSTAQPVSRKVHSGLPKPARENRLPSAKKKKSTAPLFKPMPSLDEAAGSTQNESRPSAAENALKKLAEQPAQEPTLANNIQSDAFSRRLDSIQRMIENLGNQRQAKLGEEIPDELFHLYAELIDEDVGEQLSRDLIFRLKRSCTPRQLEDLQATKAVLSSIVESEIECSGPIVPTPGRRKVVALVGPTGVGKTTTIAKLAANFRLRDGVKMGLVTVDTYRVAAVEQLRTYAEIIDLPMKVVTSPLEMRRALDELIGLDLVLIDTAGRSPRDDLQIQELKTLLAEADVDEVHLVMSLTSSVRSIEETAKKFASANVTSLLLTKLDEAAGLGAMLSVAQKVAFPISYLTTGQDVPDDIEPARAGRISRLILGQEKLDL